jgi:hypothetical protein
MNTDYGRVDAELERLGYSAERPDGDATRAAVLTLLHTLDAQDLSADGRGAVADLVATLVRDDSALGVERGEWRQFRLGDVKLGSIVRVKWDAYDSLTGAHHNGLVGVFTSAYSGRCTVRYVGRKDRVDYTHPAPLLEVLIK